MAGYIAHVDRCPTIPFNEVHGQGVAQDAEHCVAITQDNTIGIVWTLCWWAMMYSPGDSVNRVHSLLPVRMLTKAR